MIARSQDEVGVGQEDLERKRGTLKRIEGLPKYKSYFVTYRFKSLFPWVRILQDFVTQYHR